VRNEADERVPLVFQATWYRELIAAWQAWARYTRLVLTLGLALRSSSQRVVPDARLRALGFDPGPRESKIWVDEDSPYVESRSDGTLQLSELGYTLFRRISPWRLIRELDACRTLGEQRMLLEREINLRLLSRIDYGLRLGWSDAVPHILLDRP
jgi:hypothetical protein